MKPRASKQPYYRTTAPHQRGEAGRPAPRQRMAGGPPLSLNQKAKLCQIADSAFAFQDSLGLIDHDELPGKSLSAKKKAWRNAEQFKAVQIESLTDCHNGHYRSLRGHFKNLGGKEDQAFKDFTTTGRVKDKGLAHDTHEYRESRRHLIAQHLQDHADRCDPSSPYYDAQVDSTVNGAIIYIEYIEDICQKKNRGKKLAALNADKLDQMLFTTINRIASREGRPESEKGRNSKQRSKKA